MSTSTAWQASTLLDMAADPEPAFFEIVASVPPGRTFTVNDLRDRLDAAGVPAAKRGPLFAAACTAELIEPVRLTAWGRTTDVYVPSTGKTANRARVRLYRRVRREPPGPGDGAP